VEAGQLPAVRLRMRTRGPTGVCGWVDRSPLLPQSVVSAQRGANRR